MTEKNLQSSIQVKYKTEIGAQKRQIMRVPEFWIKRSIWWSISS